MGQRVDPFSGDIFIENVHSPKKKATGQAEEKTEENNEGADDDEDEEEEEEEEVPEVSKTGSRRCSFYVC